MYIEIARTTMTSFMLHGKFKFDCSLCRVNQDRMTSMATFRVHSKTMFLLLTMNQAPSLALRISNMVNRFHKKHGGYSSWFC